MYCRLTQLTLLLLFVITPALQAQGDMITRSELEDLIEVVNSADFREYIAEGVAKNQELISVLKSSSISASAYIDCTLEKHRHYLQDKWQRQQLFSRSEFNIETEKMKVACVESLSAKSGFPLNG